MGGSYTIDRTRLGNFDLLGGFRYATLKTSLDWNFAGPNGILSQSGGVSDKLNLYDGIVGFRGAVSLSPDGKWYLPYYADIGAGNDSNWTWQAYAGVGYGSTGATCSWRSATFPTTRATASRSRAST